MKPAAVAGHPAAAGGRGNDDVVGDRRRRSPPAWPTAPRWAAAQVGWTTIESSRRGDEQPLEQVVVHPGDRVDDLDPLELDVLDAAPWVHELASMTTGSRPPSLQRRSAAAVRPRHRRDARWRSPSSSTACRSSGPATSSGIQSGSPARAEIATSASGTVGRLQRRAGGAAEDPVDAGRHVHGGGAARGSVNGSSAGAGAGIAALQAGTTSAARAARRSAPGTRQPAVSGDSRRGTPGAHRPPGGPLDGGVAARDLQRHPLGARAVLAAAQLLDQLAGVDRHRAGAHARAVGRAGLRCRRTRTARAAPRAPASRAGWRAISRRSDDPLARRRRHVARRADRLAEAALDALGDACLDLRRRLEVAQVDARVAVEHHPGARIPSGSASSLDLATSSRSPCAPTRARRTAPCSSRCRARPSASRRTCRRSARPARA